MKSKDCFRIILVFIICLYSSEEKEENLIPKHKIEFKDINESSGICKSRLYNNLYWTLNDSGDKARIFGITDEGVLVKPLSHKKKYHGLSILGAYNIDWEDISTDNHGNLIIAACGNNNNSRRDLGVYIIPEVHPSNIVKMRYKYYLNFHYPDQKSFPATHKNYDCEAIFAEGEHLYFLTKHRSDDSTSMYRYKNYLHPKQTEQTLEYLSKFPIEGMVTAADCSPDGKKLAVLTYNNIWIFIRKNTDINFFDKSSNILYKEIAAKQCEAICWKNKDELLVTNEQRDIYYININSFHKRKF